MMIAVMNYTEMEQKVRIEKPRGAKHLTIDGLGPRSNKQ